MARRQQVDAIRPQPAVAARKSWKTLEAVATGAFFAVQRRIRTIVINLQIRPDYNPVPVPPVPKTAMDLADLDCEGARGTMRNGVSGRRRPLPPARRAGLRLEAGPAR